MVSVHPAYDVMFDGQCPKHLRGSPDKRRHWAADQVRKAALVSRRLGLTEHVTFTGSLAWPYFYPYPQRPAGLIEECFTEQARRWKPILDVFDENGVNLCFEIHPTEDVFDGDTFDMFLAAVGGHKRCNINYDASHFIKQCMDYLGFIDVYHERIKMFHVNDAVFNPTAKQGVYGGYKGWLERAGRDRSLGHGQVDFKAIFSKLAAYDFTGWAVYEWECCLQHPEVAAREGAKFIADHIIEVTDYAFDDFAATGADRAANLKLLGVGA
jgi:sugar phosphate isomerase/epimerase